MRALVVGGGIAGLAAAHRLAAEGADAVLLEAGTRLGGKVFTERAEGFVIEHGADAVLALRPAAIALAREVGLGAEIVPPLVPESVLIWRNGRLAAVPAGIGLGIPTRFVPFALSPLFTPLEKLRAAAEIVVPAAGASGDVAVGTFLRRRLGDAVVDRVAGPLISAIYGTDVDELSLDAVMPRLREAERTYGSLIRAGLAARRARRGEAGTGLVTLLRGLGSLVDAVAARLGHTEVRLGTAVASLERGASGYVARITGGGRVHADVVVVATPAPVAASILREIVPAASDALAAVAYRSTAAVTLGFDARVLGGPLPGQGFIVPDSALPVSACTWSSVKWPARAPEGAVLVRATIRPEAARTSTDAELVRTALSALERTTGLRADPVITRVVRWTDALPRYTVGHPDRVARIEAAVAACPGLALAGAAYRGSGVPDCITSGRSAAEQILRMERMAA